MNQVLNFFPSSAKELRSPVNLCICGMLLALRIVLGIFANFSLSVMPDAKFGFSFLPIAISAILFGPVPAMVIGAAGDLICFLLVPMGPYFFGWTLNGLLVGLIYSIFLYKNKCTLPRLVIAEVVIALAVEIPLGSLWLYIQYSRGFWAMAATRSLKYLVCVPFEILMIFFLSKALSRIPMLSGGRQ